MGNPFANAKTDGLEETEDRLGGGSFTLDTDIYTGPVKFAYAGQSEGGAHSMTFGFDFNGKEYRETVWVTNKKGENFFMSKDGNGKETGKKSALPGFTTANDIALCTVGKELSELEFAEKVVKVYDYEQKKEMPKSVQMAVELIGQVVSVAIQRQTVDKTKKNDSTGEYEPTGDVRDENVIVKVFNHELHMTVAEARATSPATFYDAWLERNKGKTWDKSSKASGNSGTAGKPGGSAPQAGASTSAAPRKSLFGGKS